jgi:iron complex outermembrane receptor protein
MHNSCCSYKGYLLSKNKIFTTNYNFLFMRLGLLRVFLITGLLVSSQTIFAQKFIEGTIKSTDGAAVASASVTIKQFKAFAVADASGHFKIAAPPTFPAVLVISSVGFTAVEINLEALPKTSLNILLAEASQLTELVVTSRRKQEVAQNVPIAISVIGGKQIEETGSFNVNRLKELLPTVQLYTSNPRNTTLNVRGLGSTFGLTNDGIDPGVGFYIDGVYYALPAATTLDFIDIEQVEVLRGPQGTLFGKNTTAGAFNITTKAASFKTSAAFETSIGNFGFIQAKASVTGKLLNRLAGRISFSGTQRNGLLKHTVINAPVNDMNNLGIRGQLLYQASDAVKVTFIGDYNDQKPNGFAQVVAGVVTTKRAAYRQFENIIKDLNYNLPSRNPFDRVIDHNTPWRSGNQLGGVSANVDAKIGNGTLTATTAWRYWDWKPSNDRDFTGLSVLDKSQAPSFHTQFSQEVRYAGNFSNKLSAVIGVFALWQDLKTDSVHTEESGKGQWRFSQSTTSALWKTPGLLDGYGIKTKSRLQSFGGAVFAQVDWSITEKLHLLPGIRFNYDYKDVNYDRKTYGGLQTNDAALIALKKLVYTDQAFATTVEESNFSGQVTLAYKANKNINAFATVSKSYKPVGVNLGGLPTANGETMLDLAKVKPEQVTHYEVGVKTSPAKNAILNIAFHHSDIKDYQTLVQTPEPGVNRGYLANAERVRVQGVELDGSVRLNNHLNTYGAIAYTDGKYVSFINAPVPLEEVGGAQAYTDASGGRLPGISKWSGSLGGELTSNKIKFLDKFNGKYFVAADVFYRSEFSSNPTPSAYLNVDGYAIVNTRAGFRAADGLSVTVWARNLFNTNYFEQLLAASGSAGHYAGVLGDQRTIGVTLKYVIQ